MILQALNEYYERKRGDNELSVLGFGPKGIPLVFELDAKGNLIQIKAYDKKTIQKQDVPKEVKRANKIIANLLYDTAEYTLGLDPRGKPDRVKKQHEAFIERIRSLPEPAKSDDGVSAVLKFLSDLKANEKENDPEWNQHWQELQKNPYVSFQLQGDNHLVCQRQAVIDAVESEFHTLSDEGSICLVTGKQDNIAVLHHHIKGVMGAQFSGASIVSYNNSAYESFGKKQGYNAPVGKRACFAYTTALNHLLRKGSNNRLQIGDASTVFWSEKPSALEYNFSIAFSEPAKDNPDAYTEAVKAIYESARGKGLARDEESRRFYVLGLVPNASRIAIRFWVVSTVKDLSKKIVRHFEDMKITYGSQEHPPLTLFRLLVNVAIQGKIQNIPPNLGGEVARSILNGAPYPYMLLTAAIRRCKAGQSVNYYRAAIIKACLNRMNNKHNQEEVSVALDKQCDIPAYCLGRLFSVFVKLQEDALPGINATISDRYYSAASCNPASVFPTLMKLHKHHLAKLKRSGQKIFYKKIIGDIMNKLPAGEGFSASSNLQDQGRFSIGFYHQRQDFFTKRSPGPTEGEKT